MMKNHHTMKNIHKTNNYGIKTILFTRFIAYLKICPYFYVFLLVISAQLFYTVFGLIRTDMRRIYVYSS